MLLQVKYKYCDHQISFVGEQKVQRSVTAKPIDRKEVEAKLAPLYFGVNGPGNNDYEKVKVIAKLSREVQNFILSDEKLCALKDDFGIGPVHDLARWGAPSVQLRIFAGRARFDTEAFESKCGWGTPLDLLAIFGGKGTLRRFLALGKNGELAKLRRNGRTLGHEIAKQIDIGNYKLFLRLPRAVHAAKNVSGDSMIRRAYDSANEKVQRKIYEWDHNWNHI